MTGLLFAAETSPATRTIVVYGDSLTSGHGLSDPLGDSYPGVLQRKIDAAKLPWKVTNAGISGDTSSGGLRRIDWTLRQPFDVFVLALGANDGLRGISPNVTRSNLQAIIDKVRATNPKAVIVLAGMMMPPSLGAEFAKTFNVIFPEVAKKNELPFVPFLLDGVGAVREMNQGDGIHPNERGHAAIAEGVWKILRPLL